MKEKALEGAIWIDPIHVQADDNSRFGLKKYRLAALKDKIVADGGVNTPVEIEPLETPVDGFTHRLTAGFYRHTAVSELNKSGAKLLLPAIIRPLKDAKERLARQLSENMDRENQSPMDKAIAIKKLLDSGVTKADIRDIFKVPGGRKGLKMQPASNSFVNMHLSFLEFPKKIQNLLHDGLIGVAAAKDLRNKYKPEEWDGILAKIEEERQKAITREENEESKELEDAKKAEAKAQKEAATATKQTTVAAEAEKTLAEAEAAVTAANEAFKASNAVGIAAEERKAREDAFKKAQADAKEKQKAAEAAKKKADKVAEQAKKAAERKAQIEAARAAKTPPAAPAPISTADVAAGAAAAGATPQTGPQHVPLTGPQLKSGISDLKVPGGYPKVQAIGEALDEWAKGVSTYKQLFTALSKITGEHAAATKPKK